VENNERLTIEEMDEWSKLRKGGIEMMKEGEASEVKVHKGNVAEIGEGYKENVVRVHKEKKKKTGEIIEDEKRGKREFWELIKRQEEREKEEWK
jgi:hypothetical protein